jgi:hypothetical protein
MKMNKTKEKKNHFERIYIILFENFMRPVGVAPSSITWFPLL